MSILGLKHRFTLLALLALAALILASCGGSDAVDEDNQSSAEVAQDFAIEVYQGEEVLGASAVSFNEMLALDKPIVLNFWAALCPPCRAEMPDLQRVSDRFSDRVLFFGLDVGPFQLLGTREEGRELLKELGITYPSGSTEDAEVIRDYGISNMPTTFFISSNGEIQRKWAGILNEEKLVELVEDLIAAS